MEEGNRIEIIKSALYELSKTHTRITLQQVKEKSGIDNPESEIEVLRKKGVILQMKSGDFRWV